MKKIITLILMVATIISAKTVNLLDWEPDYKYTSTETYPYEVAQQYCENKPGCGVLRVRSGQYSINKNIKNCPAIKTGDMDEYISDAAHMHHVIDHCFSTDKKIHYEGKGVLSFVHKNSKYYATRIQKYDNKYGYIYKIKKDKLYTVKFKEN